MWTPWQTAKWQLELSFWSDIKGSFRVSLEERKKKRGVDFFFFLEKEGG